MAEDDVRRSGRKRPRQKYTVDAFEGLEDVLYSSGDAGSSRSIANSSLASEDEEFGEQQLQELADLEKQDQAEEESLPEDETDEHFGGHELGEDDSEVEGDTVVSKKGVGGQKRISNRIENAQNSDPTQTQSRGLLDHITRNAREDRMISVVSLQREELIPFVQVRDRWINAFSLPPRKNDKHRGGGPTPTPYHAFTTEQTARGWHWYTNEGGRARAQETQRYHLAPLNEELHRPTDFPSDANSIRFIAGHVQSPSMHNLPGGCFQSLNEPYALHDDNHKHLRSGWTFNFGSQVQCLEWATGQQSSQYLAVSSRSGLAASRETVLNSNENANELSSFSPQPSTMSYLYIYEFMAAAGSMDAARIDMTQEPRLCAVLAFRWNALRRLKFCPSEQPHTADGMGNRLGLVAGVWLDGYVRVLDLELPKDRDCPLLQIEKAAFQARPPGTVCTSVTWLSSNSIAVGCANGSVGIWNLSSSIGKVNPRPWFYKSFHESYILEITSAYPSRPTFLFTCSVDGATLMTDIRDSRADSVSAARQRLIPPTMAWMDQIQGLLNMDEAYSLCARFLRHFHAAMDLNRYSSTILNLATSNLHPYVLVACADGSVFSTNATTKLTASRRIPSNRQRWFKHDWRKGMSASNIEKMPATWPKITNERSSILSTPLSRFTEGYKPEHFLFDNSTKRDSASSRVYATIHEENAGVSRVSWSPNLIASTWAAAAMGNGLIRIEDIGIDIA